MINHFIYENDIKIKLGYLGSHKGIPIYLSDNNETFYIEYRELYSRSSTFARSDRLKDIIKVIERLVK